MKVNNGPDVEVVINQSDVSADSDVTMIARRRRQLTAKVSRRGMDSFAQIPIERRAFVEAGLLIGRQAVSVTKACGWMVLMLSIPVARHLLVMLVKLSMTAAVLVVMLIALLRYRCHARKPEQRRCSYDC